MTADGPCSIVMTIILKFLDVQEALDVVGSGVSGHVWAHNPVKI